MKGGGLLGSNFIRTATATSHTLADFGWLSVNLVAGVLRQSSLVQAPRLAGRGYFFAIKKLITGR